MSQLLNSDDAHKDSHGQYINEWVWRYANKNFVCKNRQPAGFGPVAYTLPTLILNINPFVLGNAESSPGPR